MDAAKPMFEADLQWLSERLRVECDSPRRITELTSKLYCERQKPNEASSVFIMRKKLQFKKLPTQLPEESQVVVMRSLLRDNLQPFTMVNV